MAEKQERKRMFESQTLALPPLKMVLADLDKLDPSERQQRTKKASDPARQQAILRLIEKLASKE